MKIRGSFGLLSLYTLTHKDKKNILYLKLRRDLYFVGELQERRMALGVE